MQIAVVADTKLRETYDFIVPLIENNNISEIRIFGDNELIANRKIHYTTPKYKKSILLKNINKLCQVIFSKNEYDMFWGIYEIPHGLIAYLGSRIKKSKLVLSIIGNPANTKVRKGIWKRIMLFLAQNADVVTVTGSLSRQVLIDLGIEETKVLILPNPVDNTIKKNSNTKKDYDIVSIGRISPEKELYIFLDVIAELVKEFPNIKVGIAGKGPEFQNINKKIIELKLNTNIDLLGYIKDKNEFYNRGEILLLTSSTEGLPRTMLEAIKCGLVCVAPDIGDIRDLIVDGNTGFLVDRYNNINAYVQKIKYIMNNVNEMNSVKTRSLSQLNSKYSGQAIGTFWNNVLSKLFN